MGRWQGYLPVLLTSWITKWKKKNLNKLQLRLNNTRVSLFPNTTFLTYGGCVCWPPITLSPRPPSKLISLRFPDSPVQMAAHATAAPPVWYLFGAGRKVWKLEYYRLQIISLSLLLLFITPPSALTFPSKTFPCRASLFPAGVAIILYGHAQNAFAYFVLCFLYIHCRYILSRLLCAGNTSRGCLSAWALKIIFPPAATSAL